MSYQTIDPIKDFPLESACRYEMTRIPQGGGEFKVFTAYFARIEGRVVVEVEVALEDAKGNGESVDGVTLGYFDEQIPALHAAESWLKSWIDGEKDSAESKSVVLW